jgi:acyl-CoA thioesterase-1
MGASSSKSDQDALLNKAKASFEAALSSNSAKSVKLTVACVGDSITFGYGFPDESYPTVLQSILGSDHFQVHNFGVSGTTISSKHRASYRAQKEFQGAKGSSPDIVIVMLGTNDGQFGYWDPKVNTQADLENEFESLLTEITSLDPQPIVIAAIPPPLYLPRLARAEVINEIVPAAIQSVATKLNLGKCIDVHGLFGGKNLSKPEWIQDGCHPNAAGYSEIAKLVAVEVFQVGAAKISTQSPTTENKNESSI